MTDEQIVKILWDLSPRAREQLGARHITHLLRSGNPLRTIAWKLGQPGRTTVPEAYEELRALLVQRQVEN